MLRKLYNKVMNRIIIRPNCKIGLNNEKNRIEWIEKALKRIPKGSRILDAGAGELQYKKYCAHLNYVSQDFSEYDGTGDGSGLQMKKWNCDKIDIVSDIINIPEPDLSFDAIMCTEVLEHIPHPELAIKEFSRLIKKNGHLILTAPFCSLTHFSPYHFYTGFNKYFYLNILNENGFKVIESTPNGNYFEYLAQELMRLPEIACKYSKYSLSVYEYYFIKVLLKVLEKISKKDKRSFELLNYGYNVYAIKL